MSPSGDVPASGVVLLVAPKRRRVRGGTVLTVPTVRHHLELRRAAIDPRRPVATTRPASAC